MSDFYTRRNLRALALLWKEINAVVDYRVRRALQFAFTNTAWHGTKMRRYNALGGQRPLTGTLYIPQLSSEVNVLEVMRNKVRQLVAFYSAYNPAEPHVPPALRLGSATSLAELSDDTIDYAFFDPPFGSNIFYSDLNLLLESWIGCITQPNQEAVVNRSLTPERGGKTLSAYQALMTAALQEVQRVLKPGRVASIVFHNTDAAVWRSLQESIEDAGLRVFGTSGLNRSEMSMKGYKGLSDAEDVAHHDLIIHVEKAANRPPLNRKYSQEADLVDLLKNHLGSPDLPREQRTTQYLHSLVLRHLMGNSIEVGDIGYASVRNLCASHFLMSDGTWQLQDSSAPREILLPDG